MIAIGEQIGVAQGVAFKGESAPPGQANRAWQDIVAQLGESPSGTSSGASLRHESVTQLTGLLKTQMEVCRYQLKVEMVSKIAESAVASMRKLQQPQ